MTGRAVAGWGIVDGVGFATGRHGDRWPGSGCRRDGDQAAARPWRYRESGADAARGEAALGAGAASGGRRASPRACGAAAGLLILRRSVSDQGLAASSGRDAVRRGVGAASAVPLRWLWSWRKFYQLAIALSSTPELDQLRAHLFALMPYRVAAGVLAHLLPVAAGNSPETLRGHTLKIGEQLRDAAAVKSAAAAAAITLTLDATFIRGCHDGERHLEVRVGNVETSDGRRQVFASVARADTDIAVLIRRSLETVGRTADTESTAFTDGCPGLRSILAEAGITKPPVADWFHIAMRLQHAKQAASVLSTDAPGRTEAKKAIVAEVERLHWRIWNGKAKDAQLTLERIRKVMQVFKGERGHRTRGVASRKLWHALHEVDNYLRGQSAHLVNYAERYRAGLQVGTSVTEGTANFLVNRRMNKAQQMRWSRRGADLLLQVRCAVYNGALGSGFGQLFDPVSSPSFPLSAGATF